MSARIRLASRLANRLMLAFGALALVITIGLSWYAYDSARSALLADLREHARNSINEMSTEAPEKLAARDKAYFTTYFEGLIEDDPAVLYAVAIDSNKVVVANSKDDSQAGKPWTTPEGTAWGALGVERIIPGKMAAIEFTGKLRKKGSDGPDLGYLQLGLNFNSASKQLSLLKKRIFGAGVVVIIFAVVVSRLFSSQVTAGLSRLQEAAGKISDGNLGVSAAEDDPVEEIGSLARVFNSMTGTLKVVLGKIGEGSRDLRAYADQVDTVIRDQANTTTQQAASVAEITATMEELARTSRQIADNSEDVRRSAGESVDIARQGTHLGRQGVDVTARVREKVLVVSKKTAYLSEKSGEIGKILGIIKEIASEIHLLALNAAIESAAAGEHGRRFSVVASEVRRLADKTRESAETIRQLVSEIQSATQGSVEVGEESAREVETLKNTVADISEAFERIIRKIEATSDASEQISLATHQQTSANEQVVQSMRQVADLVRASAGRMNGLSASSGNLVALAERLSESASSFKS